MKHKLLSLFVLLLVATSVGWTQGDGAITTKITQETVDGKIYVYANGNPVTVTAGTNKQTIITLKDNSETAITIEDGTNLLLFGGSKDASVESSNITVTGGTIFDIYGGGYGTSKEKTADVKNAILTITGGTFTNIFGGGKYFAKITTKTTLNIKSLTFSKGNYWICPGGREDGKTQTKYPSFADSYNSVKEAVLTIDGGTYPYVAVSGATGTGGYVDKSTATINNATIQGGIYGNASNGGSNNISATLTECTFENASEIASINRGHATNVTFTFVKCHFPADNNKVDAYLGGASNWKKDYNGSEVSVQKPGLIAYTFDSQCTGNLPVLALSDGLEDANLEVTGAKVKAASFSNGVDAATNKFTVNQNASWAFNGGFEIADGATLTNYGTINATAKDLAELKAALSVNANTTLTGETYGSADASQLLGTITKSGVRIKAAANAKPIVYGSIKLKAEDCTVEGLNFQIQGDHPTRNALYVLGKSVTIQKNEFNVAGKDASKLNNGVCIYPYGNADATYVISGNKFNGFKNVQSGYQSTGLLIAEGLPIKNYFGDGSYGDAKTVAAIIADELSLWTDNTFANCYNDYAHSTWVTDGITEERKFSVLSSGDPDALSTAVHYAAENEQVHLKGEYTLTEPLFITKKVNVFSIDVKDKATINGNLVVEQEGTSFTWLKINNQSTGTKYWEKNALTLFGNTITVIGCDFRGSVASGDKTHVANGIVIFPKTAGEAIYALTGNTFSDYKQEVTDADKNYWTSTALLLSDGTSVTKKDANEPISIPALTGWNESSLAEGNNSFGSCFANYIHQTGNSYVYAVTTSAKAVADAVNSIQKDKKTGIISCPTLGNMDIEAAIKELKPSLNGKVIIRSKDGSIVTDPSLVSTGTIYLLSKNDETYTIKQQTKDPVVDFSKLDASTIEAGQQLSVSILTGGKANVAGVFSWKEPSTIVEKGSNKEYDVIFTPVDLQVYNVKEAKYTFAEIKQYYTVQLGKCANGHLEITNMNAANKYEVGTTLVVKPVADANYAFDKYLNKTGFADNMYTVSNNATLTAQFKPVMRTVTILTTGDGVVNVNGEAKTSPFEMQQGSILTVQAVPGINQMLSSLTAGGAAINNGNVTVGSSNLAIAATFAAKPADKYALKVNAVPNGKISLYDAKGNAIASGSTVEKNAVVSVVAVPDLGYELQDNSLKYNTSVVIQENKFTVTADATVTATFNKQSFAVSFGVSNGTMTLKKDGTDVTSGSSVEFGTNLTATATAAIGYKLLSLIVNGKEIPNGGTFVVSAKTTVTAVTAKLAEVTIDKSTQFFTYDRETKAFVVKTTPAGITGFNVTYNATPTNAGEHVDKEYTVTIKREADDVYAAVDAIAKLVIRPAQLKGVAIPTLDKADELVSITDERGSYALEGAVDGTTHIGLVKFTPTDHNQAIMYFSAAGTQAIPCTYPSVQTTMLSTRAGGSSLNIRVKNPAGGSVKVLNGGVEASQLYVGQKVTLQAIPATTDYAALVTWDGTGTRSNSKEITLAEGENKIDVEFFGKEVPSVKLATIPIDMVYNGTLLAGKTISIAADSPVKDWSLSFENGIPADAGTYKIYATRAADDNYQAVVNKEVGSFTIQPKGTDAKDLVATDILQGQSLAQSVITGTADVDGVFEWIEPTKVLNDNATNVPVRFVPTSKNYTVKTGLTTNVTVTKTGVTIRTLNLAVTGQEYGAVSMTLDGAKVDAGATVTKDQKLVVVATTNSGYKASITVNGSAYTSGNAYTIEETGNVEVKVAFTAISNPGGDDTDDDNDTPTVITIQLDAVEKTLKVGDEFTLKAIVTGSTDKIAWTSSDDKVATVTEGKVKALKAGITTITATIGQIKAECKVTVAASTGLDEILAKSRIYGTKGLVVIEPAATMQIVITNLTGYNFYANEISSPTRILVPAGIYLISFSDGRGKITEKISVR